MVHQPPERRPLENQEKFKLTPLSLSFLVAGFIAAAAGIYGLLTLTLQKSPVIVDPKDEEVTSTETETESKTSKFKLPEFIDLQALVDDWTSSLNKGAKVGLEIYDLNNKKVAAKKNADSEFQTASLYKMFIVYEGYKEIESGDLDGNATLVNGNSILKCLDLAFRESDSPCAESLWSKIGRDKIEDIIEDEYKLKNSSAKTLTSTPSDIVSLLEIYYYHKDLTENSYSLIKDSLLDQPAIKSNLCGGYCNFRLGLPSGFSDDVRVYNKVGYESDGVGKVWKIYNDAAIIEFPKLGRAYIISVFTENLPWSNKKIQALSDLASSLEKAINQN